LLGLSGITPYVYSFVESNIHSGVGDFVSLASAPNQSIVYPILTALGLGLMGITLFQFGREQFDAPRWRSPNAGRSRASATKRWASGSSWPLTSSSSEPRSVRTFSCAFTAAGVTGTSIRSLWQGLFNTYVLLTSSFTVILAHVMAERGNKKGLLGALSATILLGFVFMGVKAFEYSSKFADGHYWFSGIEYSLYFVTTGLHALHVILGLLIAGFMIYRVVSIDAYLEDHMPVEYFGLYWHFVDIVWVFLFPTVLPDVAARRYTGCFAFGCRSILPDDY